MVFSSILYLLYFLPVVLLVYYLAPVKWKNIVLLVASVFFYSWGAPKFIFVILGTTTLDYYLVNTLSSSKDKHTRVALLVVSLCLNLGLLIYFKYLNFFIDNVNALFAVLHLKPLVLLNVVLPIGISFYTFESITYMVDVYKGKHEPQRNFWEYQLYILLFPKLIAGPIIRYHEIADQLTSRFKNDTIALRLNGFNIFAIGLGQKVLLSNRVGEVADSLFGQPVDTLSSFQAWIGILAYTFQIYFDFSGYSNMAIGVGKMLGFRFPENFNNPYSSLSITEFWRRWHMTLGNWMRNYLYIPLGGNRNGTALTYLNLWVVFLLSGIWHGASWTFVLWGAYHGILLVIERIGLSSLLTRLPKGISLLYTFSAVLLGWVFFRADSIGYAFDYLIKLFSFTSNTTMFTYDVYIFLGLAGFFSFFTFFSKGIQVQKYVFEEEGRSIQGHTYLWVVSAALFLFSIGSIAVSNFNPFIYFRF